MILNPSLQNGISSAIIINSSPPTTPDKDQQQLNNSKQYSNYSKEDSPLAASGTSKSRSRYSLAAAAADARIISENALN